MYKCLTVPSSRHHFFFINKEEYESLLARKDNRYEDDRKLFLLINCKANEKIYTAIDNIAGEFYVEDFTSLNDALVWLMDLKESEPLKKAEEQEWWY